jgi:hypothetical protein
VESCDVFTARSKALDRSCGWDVMAHGIWYDV